MNWEPHHFTCELCGCEIDERFQIVWNKVEGWEKKRDQGGTNHIACRRPQPFYRCDPCMDKVLSGLHPAQTSLLDV